MADVRITLYTGNGDYEVHLYQAETNGEAWGADKSHLDILVDEAVRRIKRVYGGTFSDPPENPTMIDPVEAVLRIKRAYGGGQ